MHSQTLPAFFRSAGTDAEIKKREESSSLIKLELGIAGCESVGHKNPVRLKQEKAESPFTAEQLQELYYQTLVFNFIVYGLPAPFQLLLPIWKSVFHSDPSFTGFSNQNSDHESMMDLEQGRCRRTDGRKWRCSKNALPREKYCDRHMHRGRKCSRKHVEHFKSDPNDEILTSNIRIIPSKTISDPNCETITPNIRIKPISSSIPCDLDLTFSSSNPSNGVTAIKHGSNISQDFIQPTIKACKHSVELKNNLSDDTYNAATITPTSDSGKEAIGNRSMKNRSNHIEDKDAGFNNVKARKVHIRNNNVCENNYSGSNATGFGVSRDSVLQSGSGSRCVTLGLLKETLTEAEPHRCKRTDGKKWRCSKDVVLGQNYCNSHMHRGAKRIILDSALANGARLTQSGCTSLAIPKGVYNSINLNAKPASPQELTENKSTGSSDATTITYENVSPCNTLAISP